MRRDMECRGRIVVVSADGDAGHDPAAAELAQQLRGRGFLVDRLNLVDILPGPVRRACQGARRLRPWSRDVHSARTGGTGLSVSLLRALLRPVRHRMCRSMPPDTRAVVTTSPVVDQLLRPLRGRLTVPVIAYGADVVAGTGAGSRKGGGRAVDLIAEAAARPGTDRGARRRTFVDSVGETVGDAVAVLAALLQASGRKTRR